MLQRLLNILGWLGTALVFVAVAMRWLKPEWAQYAIWMAWGGLGGVLLYTAGQWREIAAMFTRRQARQGILASSSVLIVLGILIAVNYISSQQNRRFDLTANKQHSLSDQTVQLLRGLEEPVKFLAFDRPTGLDRFRTVLAEYQYHSDQVQVELIDPAARPLQAREYDVTQYSTIVLEYQNRRERVNSDLEPDLTNALIKVMTPTQKKVYFVQGHGEKSLTENDQSGYSTIANTLERDNYLVESIALAQNQEVPDDASVLIIAGPTADLFDSEIDLLRRYLNRGGHVLMLLDPPNLSGNGTTPGIESLLREWAIDTGSNVVVDSGTLGQLVGAGPDTPVAASYPSHIITERFNLLTAYPLAQSVEPMTGHPNGYFPQTIVETSGSSWAESNISGLLENGEGIFNEDEGDQAGPVSIAVVVSADAPDAVAAEQAAQENQEDSSDEIADESQTPETRIAVFGDSDFIANGTLSIQGNSDLFMNSVSWLAQQENLISIRPRQAAERRLTMTAGQQSIMLFITLGVPLVLFSTAIYTWSRRR